MTPERWRQVEAVYHTVIARPAGERAGVVADLCGSDEVLRHEVESLLARAGEASAFLETPAFAAASIAGEGPLIGRRFGSYLVRSLLGVGGMGEVYRAHDGQLGREVAIKILPRLFSGDPERLARFEGEARVLAALNHPHIGAIYGLEHVDGSPALVLELVEGETLAEQIAKGRLPLDQALTIARQIADALEAAHERGIVHRDLKPANIKITPDGVVKVLDFGLAKLGVRDVRGPGPELANSPTMIGTREGVILGSAAYMSPEQARGAAVDKRTDIWAFGCVLYEMLTGGRAFGGDALSETLAAVLKDEPDLNRVPSPARVLVQRCLEKDPKRRLRDIADAMPLLETVPQVGVANRVDRRWIWVAAAVAAVCLIGALAIAVVHFREQPQSFRPVQFQVQTPETTARFGGFFALSPSGRMVAFVAMVADEPHLWVHSFETGQSRPLLNAGPVGNAMFWSPDSRFLAFPSEGKLKKISVVGEHVQPVCDLPPGSTYGGGAWNAQNVIVFGGSTGLMQVPAEGGVAAPVTVLDRSRGDKGHPGPRFLPDGRHLLYFRNSFAETQGIYVASLDVKPEAQSLARVVASASRPIFAAAGVSTGHLLFLREQTLFAQPFDPDALRLIGEAFVIAEKVGLDPGIGLGWVSATPEGTVAYRAAAGTSGAPIWVNRAGLEVVTIGAEIRDPQYPRLSPDGKRLVLVAAGDLWEYDLQGRPPVKLTAEGSVASPLWTPDGKSLVYESGNAPSLRIIAAAAGATSQPASPDGHYHPHGWSPDGRDLIVAQLTTETGWDIVRFAPDVKSQLQFVVKTPAFEGGGGTAPSPDGRWLAYVSDTTGRAELWVQPFPGPGSPVRISSRGGVEPVWARNGRELYYLEGNKLMAVAVDTGAEFNFKAPVLLFEYRYQRSLQPPSYDVGVDGRFLVIKPSKATPLSAITVISNWAQTAASSR